MPIDLQAYDVHGIWSRPVAGAVQTVRVRVLRVGSRMAKVRLHLTRAGDFDLWVKREHLDLLGEAA